MGGLPIEEKERERKKIDLVRKFFLSLSAESDLRW